MSRHLFFLSLLLSFVLLVVTLPSFAKSKNKGKSSQLKTMAQLTSCCETSVPGVEGHVDYKAKTKKGRVNRVDLKVVVEATSDTDLPPGPRDLRLILSKGGVEYAECLLVPGGENDEGEEGEVEFKLDQRQKKGGFEEKKGSCDTDLRTTDVQHGIPAIQVGDVAIVTLVRDPLDRTKDLDFLMGVFD